LYAVIQDVESHGSCFFGIGRDNLYDYFANMIMPGYHAIIYLDIY